MNTSSTLAIQAANQTPWLAQASTGIPVSLPGVWTFVAVALLLLNFKNLPPIWHFRIVNALSYVLRSQRMIPQGVAPNIFDAVVTESLSPLMELDFNLHKSNSTYFSDVDIARTHLICTLFNRALDEARFASPTAATVDSNAPLSAMLAGVCCTFKREIKPYERYLMWSRILCWDHKWFWVVTWFVEPDDGQGKDSAPKGRRIFATAISKCVFKKGRLTVLPDTMIEKSKLIPGNSMDGPRREDIANIHGIPLMDEIELRRQAGLKVLEAEDGLETLHGLFNSDDRILARRPGLDFSPLLALRILILFVEWLKDRAARVVRKHAKPD